MRTRLLPHVGIAVLFAVLTLGYTYPLWLTPATALNELGDVRLNAWILAWDAHAFLTQPWSFFDANIFHPHANALAFSENLLGTAVLVAPVNWLGQPILAYNLALLAGIWLTGVATAYWVRALSGSTAAGVIAGVAWTFAPVRSDHLPQIQLLTAQWLSFSLLALWIYARSKKRRHLVAAALMLAWQYAAGLQFTLLMLPLVAIFAVRILGPQLAAIGPRRGLADATVAAALFIALTLPLSVPYLTARDAEGFARDLNETRGYAAEPRSLIAAGSFHPSQHLRFLNEKYRRTEANFFPGLLTLALAAIGMGAAGRELRRGAALSAPGKGAWNRARGLAFRAGLGLTLSGGSAYLLALALARWRERPAALTEFFGWVTAVHPELWLFAGLLLAALTWRPRADLSVATIWTMTFAAIAVMAFLLATGPDPIAWNSSLGAGPFGWLHAIATPYRSIRAVGRFGLCMTLALAPIAGFGFLRLTRRLQLSPRALAALTLLLSTAMLFEVRVTPFPNVDATLQDAPLYERLAEVDANATIVHVPLSPTKFPHDVTEYMLGSTRHWLRLVNGFSGFRPEDFVRLGYPAPLGEEFFDRLREGFSTDWIAVHGRYLPDFRQVEAALLRSPELRLEGRWGDTLLFRFLPAPERGAVVRRRFAAAQLRRPEPLRFEVRAAPGSWPAAVELRLGGHQVAVIPTTNRFETVELSVPADFPSAADGTVTLSWRGRDQDDPGRPVGASGRLLAADTVVDVHGKWTGVAIDNVYVERRGAPGALVVTLAGGDGTVSDTRQFGPDSDGFQRLHSYLASLPPGQITALALYSEEDRPIRATQISKSLRLLGARLDDGESFYRGAILGVIGSAPGTAIADFGGGMASVRAGIPMEQYPHFVLRNVHPPGGTQRP